MFFPEIELCNRYKLLKILSRGGMGEVWLAEDKVLDRKVAIKTISPSLLEDNPGAISIFQDEAKIGASLLGHPNIVAILDYGKHSVNDQEEEYFMVMEYVKGLNVSTFINNFKTQLDEETYYFISLFIAWEIGRAINYAHNHGILHRDIKPLNAFISEYGITKVGDFGLARFIDAVTRTHTVSNFNSPPYCAPEQWKGEDYKKDTDIYQFGATLYHLFTGRFLFEKTRTAQMYAHLNEKPEPPMNYCKKMTKELSATILHMVSKDSDDRASLWQLNDILANELQRTFKLQVSVDKKNADTINKVCMITDFPREDLKKTGKYSFKFPDFNEVMSEGIQLILNDISSFQIKAIKVKPAPVPQPELESTTI
jgi:serine/threonine protein kinase